MLATRTFSQLKKVVTNISGSSGLDFVDPPTFSNASELRNATREDALRECVSFKEAKIDPAKCIQGISVILYLINRGEEYTDEEKEEIFFSVTRLFQHPSKRLRRMTHLIIKTLRPSADVAFIVTSSLTKDISETDDALRVNALRTIVHVVDSEIAKQLERYLQSAIVSSSPLLSSTALTCCMRLFHTAPELVRRWLNEITDKTKFDSEIVQFHALVLLQELNRDDRLALHRIITTTNLSHSPLGECVLIRSAIMLLSHPGRSPLDECLINFVNDKLLPNNSEIVSFEAAKSLLLLAFESPKYSHDPFGMLNLAGPVGVLGKLLSHAKGGTRLAAMRVFYRVAQAYPDLIIHCVDDIEQLINDSHRSVAVLALITLLKANASQDVTKLVGQVQTVISETVESQRKEIIIALTELAISHPQKAKSIVLFLSQQLRADAGRPSKAATCESLCRLAVALPEVHEIVLVNLCDFIEDCEYQALSCYVLAFLAEQAPLTPTPLQFLHYIFNRAILESPSVRSAAVDTLVRIGIKCPDLKGDIVPIFTSALIHDTEDEVRERARLSLKQLVTAEEYREIIFKPAEATEGSTTAGETDEEQEPEDDELDEFGVERIGFEFSIDALVEAALVHVNSKSSAVVDVASLPGQATWIQKQRLEAREKIQKEGVLINQADADSGTVSQTPGSVMRSQEGMKGQIDDLLLNTLCADMKEKLSPKNIHHVTVPIMLTEKEAEYPVECVKHVWDDMRHIIVELEVRNTLENHIMEKVTVGLTGSPSVKVVAQTVIGQLKYGARESIYILCDIGPDDNPFNVDAVFHAQLKYVVREDQDDDGYEDTYGMEDIRITGADLVCPTRWIEENAGFPAGQEYDGLSAIADRYQSTSQTLKLAFPTTQGDAVHIFRALGDRLSNFALTRRPDSTPQAHGFFSALTASKDPVVINAHFVDSKQGTLAKIVVTTPTHELTEQFTRIVKLVL